MSTTRKWSRYVPHVVVFFTSMGMMIIELVASRLVSKYFGNSLYTWTGVIGVVLGGISLGNYLGGKLADRYPPRRLITPLLLAASLLVFLILALDLLLHALLTRGGAQASSAVTGRMVLESVAVIAVLFLLPAAALGTVSPVMVKFALQESSRVGNTVGAIYALSSVGSIMGTFLSGFVLIPLLGITTVVLVVGLLIALLALLAGGRRPVSAAWAGGILVFAVLLLAGAFDAPGTGAARGADARPASAARATLYQGESMYSHIEVRDEPRGRYTERMLILDGLIHNRYNPADPDELLYEYELIFSALVDRTAAGRDRAFSTLTLGGGACIFPFYLDRRYPSSRNRIVEIDPRVIEVARRYFDVPDSPRTRITLMDARQFVSAAGGSPLYDLIFLDAFSSYSIPYHLTTREFTEQTAGLLAPGGLFVVNAIDVFTLGRFLNAYLNTLQAVFPHVRVYNNPGMAADQRATFVLVASRSAGLPASLEDASGRRVAVSLSEGQLADLRRRNGPGLLSDEYAPVESLIAPVFLHSVSRD